MSSGYSAISLYAGAGGLDLGFRRAKFDLLWAIDADEHAVDTYRENLGAHIAHGALPVDCPPADLAPDVIIGGPPCQGFSVLGRMDPADPRSRQVFTFLDLVEAYRPRAFVLENVKALAHSPRWARTLEALRQRAESGLGYAVEILVLNAADYAVPQARERMFMVGARDGLPLGPVPTTKNNAPTVRAALERLPKFGSPGNDSYCTAKVVPAAKPVMRPSAWKGSLLFNGSGRPLELDGPAKTLPASMGGNAAPIIDEGELSHGLDPWVESYHQHLIAGGEPYRKAPARIRRITVQEAAALQGFPNSWTWHGPPAAQYRQIGNAVPPNLAYAVAVSIRQALEAADATREDSWQPNLIAA